MNKKIVIYYEQYGYGGVDTHMAELINSWPNKKNQFIVVTNPGNQGLKFLTKKIKNKNFKIIILKKTFLKKNKNQIINLAKYIFTLGLFFFEFSYLIKKIKPDVLLSNNGGYPGGLTCFFANLIFYKKFSKKGNFLLIHHAPHKAFWVYKTIADFLSSLINRLSIGIITVSKASKKEIENHSPLKNIKIIYNGIENKRFIIPKNRKKNKKKIVLGMSGPIDDHKGHNFIIDVFSSLQKKSNKNIVLNIVGGGQKNYINFLKKKVIQKKLSKKIFFYGLFKKKINLFLNNIDIYLMPTQTFEGFGYSMAEAMQNGLPVVASKVGAISEIVKNNKNGFVIIKNNYSQWTKIILDLSNNYKKRIRIGLAANLTISKKFNSLTMSNKYYNLFKNYL